MQEDPLKLDREAVDSVVDHMNHDHQDACLDIVRAFGPNPEAVSATMVTFDANGMEFTLELPHAPDESSHKNAATVQILFPKPLNRTAQIRGMLVAMTKEARRLLSG